MFALAFAFVAALAASDPKEEHPPPFDAAGTPLETMVKLAGDWVSGDEDGDGQPDAKCSYRVTSNGSAVIERLFEGTDHEMVTMYNLDGGKLVMTHYCALGNQPRLEGDSSKPGVVAFTFRDGMNMDPAKDHYMGAMTLTVLDSDHMRQEWKHHMAGEELGGLTLNFTRVK